MGIDQTSTGCKTNPILNPAIGLAGFGLLLGWHFIILFNPMQYEGSSSASEFMLARQVGINASLCVFFLISGKLLSKLPPRDKIKSHLHVYIAMVAGMLGTLGLMLFSYIGMAIVILSVILVGAAEALMMLMWLRFYTETSKNYSGQTLGVSAVIASLITFFVYHLTFDMVVIVSVLLPALSGISLVVTTRDIPLRYNELNGTSTTDWTLAKKPFMKMTVQLAAMAAFFGLVQGCYSPDNMLLPMTDPSSILGAALAGIVIFLLFSRSEFPPSLNPVVNISIIMFAVGILIVPYRNEALSSLSAFLIMTGFIFYFLLVLIFIIDLVRTFDLNLTMALGINQSVEYAMFTVSILIGYYIWGNFGNLPTTAFMITSACSVVLITIVLVFSTERPPWRASFYKHSKSKSNANGTEDDTHSDASHISKISEAAALQAIAVEYCLTPREVEVFKLLAKGRNAEYIQNSLVISNHTVKTHIYNIYKKLDVHSLQGLLDIIDLKKDPAEGASEKKATTDDVETNQN